MVRQMGIPQPRLDCELEQNGASIDFPRPPKDLAGNMGNPPTSQATPFRGLISSNYPPNLGRHRHHNGRPGIARQMGNPQPRLGSRVRSHGASADSP